MANKELSTTKTQPELTPGLPELLTKKEYGDLKIVGKMLGTTKDNASRLLNRPNAKRHNEAVTALARVVENRELLIN